MTSIRTIHPLVVTYDHVGPLVTVGSVHSERVIHVASDKNTFQQVANPVFANSWSDTSKFWMQIREFFSAIDFICFRLNSKCIVRPAEDPLLMPPGGWGADMKGPLGSVLRGDADIGLAGATFNMNRTAKLDMVIAETSILFHVYISESQTQSTGTGSILGLALSENWAWGVLGIMALAFTFLLIHGVLQRSQSSLGNSLWAIVRSCQYNLSHLLDITTGINFAEDTVDHNLPIRNVHTLALQTFGLVWGLFSLLAVTIVSTQLSSSLMLPNIKRLPFVNVQELLVSDFQVYASKQVIAYLHEYADVDWHDLAQRIRPLEPYFYNNKNDSLTIVQLLDLNRGRTAILASDEYFRLQPDMCSFSVIIAIPKVIIIPTSVVVLKKGSPLMHSVQQSYELMRNVGLHQANRDHNKVNPAAIRCGVKYFSQETKSKLKQISLLDLKIYLASLAISLSATIFICYFELVNYRFGFTHYRIKSFML